MARYGYWKTGSNLLRLVFLEEAALKITFVKIKNLLAFFSVLQGKNMELMMRKSVHTLRRNRT